MIKTDDASLAVLNSLLPICHDSQQGYEAAAAEVTDPELADVFNEFAVQRITFIKELHERVRALRGEPAKSGSVAGSLHRAWMDLKADNTRARSHAMLVECERAEDVAVAAYAGALQTRDVDKQTIEIVQRHYELVQAAHDRVRQLRDSANYADR